MSENENEIRETDEEYDVIDIAAIEVAKLGRQGENDTQEVQIDCSAWLTQLPGCELIVAARRSGEKNIYLPTVTVADGVITWPILAQDTEKAGYGQAEVRASLNGKIKKSKIFRTFVEKALDGPEGASPAPLPDWVEDVRDAAEGAQASAEAAQQAADEAAGIVLDGVVRHDVSQSLGEAGKAKARSNIGAIGPLDIGSSGYLFSVPEVTAEAGDAPVSAAVFDWAGPFEAGMKLTVKAGSVTGAQSADSCLCVILMAGETVIRRVYGGADGTTAEIAATDLSAGLDQAVFAFTPQQTGTMSADAAAEGVRVFTGETEAFTPSEPFVEWLEGKYNVVATRAEAKAYLGIE